MNLDFFSLLKDLPYHLACSVLADYYEDNDLPFAAAFWRRRAAQTKPPRRGALSQAVYRNIRMVTYPDRLVAYLSGFGPTERRVYRNTLGIVHAEPYYVWTREGLHQPRIRRGNIELVPMPGYLPVYDIMDTDVRGSISEEGLHLTDGVFPTPRPALKAYTGFWVRTPIYLTVDGEVYISDRHSNRRIAEGVVDLLCEDVYREDMAIGLDVTLFRGEDGSECQTIEY